MTTGLGTNPTAAAPVIAALRPGARPAPTGSLRRVIPNYLTAARVLFALGFFAVLTPWRFPGSAAHLSRPDPWLLAATALFLVAVTTDALDGYLARKWGSESTFGRIMDPFADKLLVVGAFVYLAGPGFFLPPTPADLGFEKGVQVSGVAPWMVALVLGRELLVTCIRGVLEADGVRFPSDWSGKIKMILQSALIPIVLITIATLPVIPRQDHIPIGRLIVDVAVWLTACVTVWSGIPYISRAATSLRHRSNAIA
ncbi:MAG: CDP-alcohol phosphatidyltransferase family protein [Phycisphaerae bacterium]|nr:CDP-alcohol phosphatidyltransferase family protein [Phycisphaerae bacterium]